MPAYLCGESPIQPSAIRKVLVFLAALFGVIFVVEFCVRAFHVPPYLLPPPSVILRSLVVSFPTIGHHLWITVIEAVSGFTIATAAAIVAAVIANQIRSLEGVLFPFAVIVQTIPIIIITPLLVVLMGNGIAPKIAVAALISFFPTFVNMMRGLKAVDTTALKIFSVLDASKLQILWRLRVPWLP